jgi:hypothetical protein
VVLCRGLTCWLTAFCVQSFCSDLFNSQSTAARWIKDEWREEDEVHAHGEIQIQYKLFYNFILQLFPLSCGIGSAVTGNCTSANPSACAGLRTSQIL